MFPQFVCEICGNKLDHNGTTCQKCATAWIKKLNEKTPIEKNANK